LIPVEKKRRKKKKKKKEKEKERKAKSKPTNKSIHTRCFMSLFLFSHLRAGRCESDQGHCQAKTLLLLLLCIQPALTRATLSCALPATHCKIVTKTQEKKRNKKKKKKKEHKPLDDSQWSNQRSGDRACNSSSEKNPQKAVSLRNNFLRRFLDESIHLEAKNNNSTTPKNA
jgi:hypothetical protein